MCGVGDVGLRIVVSLGIVVWGGGWRGVFFEESRWVSVVVVGGEEKCGDFWFVGVVERFEVLVGICWVEMGVVFVWIVKFLRFGKVVVRVVGFGSCGLSWSKWIWVLEVFKLGWS